MGQRTKLFTALRAIEPGEEITVNYNGDPEDGSPVGFEVIETRTPAAGWTLNGKVGKASRSDR